MGEFDNVTSAIPLQSDDVQKAMEKLLSSTDFVLKSYKVSPAGDGLLGFLGDHSVVDVTYESDGKASNVTIFSKSYPVNNKERAIFNDEYGTFEREAFVFTNILNKFTISEECKTWSPKCLRVSNRLFLFEDLKTKGYRMRSVKDSMDKAHIFIALTTLARFHSATIIHDANQNNLRLQNLYENDLCETIFADNSWFKVAADTALKLAEVSEKYGKDTPHFKTVAEKWNDVFLRGASLSGPSDDALNVVTHGDLWNNNLMYRYDEDGNPVQCVLVDFQACRFAPPAADVMSFLHMNQTIEELDRRVYLYLMYYYKELKRELSENAIDIDEIVTWDDFLKTCKVHQNWGLVQTVINLQFFFRDTADIVDAVNDSDAFLKMIRGMRDDVLLKLMESNAVFKNRMMSVIERLIETYIIKC